MADVSISTALTGIAEVQSGLKRISDAIGKDLPAATKKADDAVTKTKTGLNTLGTAASSLRVALGSLGVVFGAATVVNFIANTFRAADALKAAAQAAAISVEDLQRWRFAAEQTGIGAASMDTAILQLNKRLGDFVIDGTGPAKEAFEQLGLSAKITSGDLSGVGPVLDAVIKGLIGIEDPARQSAILAGLFGREAGPRMASLLAEGEVGIEKLKGAIQVLSKEQVDRADELGDRWNEFSTNVVTALQKVVLAAADYATKMDASNQVAINSFQRVGIQVGVLIAQTSAWQKLSSEVSAYGKTLEMLTSPLATAENRTQRLVAEAVEHGNAMAALVPATQAVTAATKDETSATLTGADATSKATEATRKYNEVKVDAATSAISGLQEELRLIGLTAREREIATAVIDAQNSSMEQGNLLTQDQIGKITALTGALFDKKEAIRAAADEAETAAEREADAWSSTMLRVTDTTVRWSSIVSGIHRSFQTMFVGLGQSLFQFIEGAKTATDVIKGFFEDLATSVLNEFARIAASQVFRVLFSGLGEVGGGQNFGTFGQGQQLGAGILQSGGLISGGGIAGSGAVGGFTTPGGQFVPSLGAGAAGAGPTAGASAATSGLAGLGGGMLISQLLQQQFGLSKGFGVAGGALAGAGIGFALGGPIGAAFGGVAGLLGGMFQHGGEFMVSRPTMIGVGELGPERVSITPMGGRAGSGGSGAHIHFHGGITVLDDLNMIRLERRLAGGVGRQRGRTV